MDIVPTDLLEYRRLVIPANTLLVERIDAAARAAGQRRDQWVKKAIIRQLNLAAMPADSETKKDQSP
ncbi:hypothetical protein NKH41_12145 [Mesorhizobium sp. M1169]|uniref:hypothetical protein n=1 Tax=Mesorhizobium sp. M1169 TaxID=2957066 RepID=UPI003335FF0C